MRNKVRTLNDDRDRVQVSANLTAQTKMDGRVLELRYEVPREGRTWYGRKRQPIVKSIILTKHDIATIAAIEW